MTMFKFSSKQHCNTIPRRVVHQVKGMIEMNLYIKQSNLVTRNNMQT
jgi:hypothetical protein